MKALVVGSEGRVGRHLLRSAPAGARAIGYGRGQLDVTDRRAVAVLVEKLRPDVIFNAAAYTAVDAAESEPGAAFATNAAAVGNLAEAAGAIGARLVHLSTDFVFDGAGLAPYAPEARPAPRNVYGRSKLAGEELAGDAALIVRTAWLYAPTGPGFVHTILDLMARMPHIEVVEDQIGTPTYVPGLAKALWDLAARGATGRHHYADGGACSRHEFALAIQEEAIAAGLVARRIPIVPIRSCRHPAPARRPRFAVLDTTATFALLERTPRPWRDNLHHMIANLRRAHG